MNHQTGSTGIVDIFAECERRREFRSPGNEAWVGVVKAVGRQGKAIIKRRQTAFGRARRPFLCSPLVAGVAVYAFLGGVHTRRLTRGGGEPQNACQTNAAHY